MKKLLSLLFVILVINITSLAGMQPGRSGLSKKELKLAGRVARKQADFESRHPDHFSLRGNSNPSGRIRGNQLLVLCMIGLLLSQTSGVTALSNDTCPSGLQSKAEQKATDPIPVAHYRSEETLYWRNQIWQQVFDGKFEAPEEKSSISTFISTLVRSAREKGSDGAKEFLEEAIEQGFVLDSFSYVEDSSGKALFDIRHFMILNEISKDCRKQMENVESLRFSTDQEIDYQSSIAWMTNGDCGGFVDNLHMRLRFPFGRSLSVHVVRKS